MTGIEKVATLTIAVKDQEEALRWFTEKLAFEKRIDQYVGSWQGVRPACESRQESRLRTRARAQHSTERRTSRHEACACAHSSG